MKNLRLLLALLCITAVACDDSDSLNPESQEFKFEVPVNFPQPFHNLENTMTTQGVALGRTLFYDVRLSGNNKISCASCHRPELAFTDGVTLSKTGVSGTELHRHAPTLVNLAWAGNGLFWDGGSTNLESQAFGPLTSTDEMHQDLHELVRELNAVPDYVASFKSAFKSEITVSNVVKALAQFQRSLVSAGSRYDSHKRNPTKTALTAYEQQGLLLVQQQCQSCHAGALFTDNDYHNNGIDSDFQNEDFEGVFQGRSRITYNSTDLGKFRTPTLRNVALTAPYMHDGRFATLEEVINHYGDAIKPSATLDHRLTAGGIGLTQTEKKQILAFLHTLTDMEFAGNPKHQKP